MLRQAIQGISDLIIVPGLINLDFADVKTIMAGMGFAIMGTGTGEGDGRAMNAANAAISSPLLEDASVKGARGVIINVTGGTDLSLIEVSEASAIIQEAAHEEANIIFGAVVDPKMEGKVKITVIATGFDRSSTSTSSSAPVSVRRLRHRPPKRRSICSRTPRGSRTQESVSRWPADRAWLRAAVRSSICRWSPRARLPTEADTASPGAEFEPASPLDVPAFLQAAERGLGR